MTPLAVLAAVERARRHPKAFADDAAGLEAYLRGLVAGAAPDDVDVRPIWRGLAAESAAPPEHDESAACDVALRVVDEVWSAVVGEPFESACEALRAAAARASASLSAASGGALRLDLRPRRGAWDGAFWLSMAVRLPGDVADDVRPLWTFRVPHGGFPVLRLSSPDPARAEVDARLADADALEREFAALLCDDGSPVALAVRWLESRGHAGGGPDAAEAARLGLVARCAAREHAARLAWLESPPAGSCASPPPPGLVAAEAATAEALRALRAPAAEPGVVAAAVEAARRSLASRRGSWRCAVCLAEDVPTAPAPGGPSLVHLGCPVLSEAGSPVEPCDPRPTDPAALAIAALADENERLRAEVEAGSRAVALDALRRGGLPSFCAACEAPWPQGARSCPACGHPDAPHHAAEVCPVCAPPAGPGPAT